MTVQPNRDENGTQPVVTPVETATNSLAVAKHAVETEEHGAEAAENATEAAASDVEEEDADIELEGEGMTEAEENHAFDWRNLLDRDDKGKLRQTLKNAELIFENDEALVGLIGKNSFSEKIEIRREPPWERPSLNDDVDITIAPLGYKTGPLWVPEVPEPEWRNSNASEMYAYLSRVYKFEKQSIINDCVQIFAGRNRFHPVREYLKQLKWDGRPRVDTLIHDYFGVPDNEYLRKVMRKTLLGAVKRIWEPGCQFDTVLTFYGPQGCGKSMFWTNLVGRWFNDLVVSFSGRDAMHGLEGAWITELAEMAALSNTGVEKNKSMISRKNDRFRKAYEKLIEDHPRQGIFVATTNCSDFLKDFTGNRRYWIADVTSYAPPMKSVHDDLPAEADQIWAEVQALYEKHEETVFADQDMIAVVERIQRNFTAFNPVQDAIEEYLERLLPTNWSGMTIEEHVEWLRDERNHGTVRRTQVCVQEVVREALDGVSTVKGKTLWNQVSDIISNIGYADGTHWHRPQRQARIVGYGKQRIFELH